MAPLIATISMHVGFTGTRRRLLPHQQRWIERELRLLEVSKLEGTQMWLHHGDCVGADAFAHQAAQALRWQTHLHPPIDESRRAFSKGASRTSGAMGFLARDRLIVQRCSIILGVPGTAYRSTNESGSWYTLLYGMGAGREVRICPIAPPR